MLQLLRDNTALIYMYAYGKHMIFTSLSLRLQLLFSGADQTHNPLIRSSSGSSPPSHPFVSIIPQTPSVTGWCGGHQTMGGGAGVFMMSDACWWVIPSDSWCWVKHTVMGRQRSEKPLPQWGRRGRGRESGTYAVAYSNCKAGLLSFCHDQTSACWLCIHYSGRQKYMTEVAWHKMLLCLFLSFVSFHILYVLPEVS